MLVVVGPGDSRPPLRSLASGLKESSALTGATAALDSITASSLATYIKLEPGSPHATRRTLLKHTRVGHELGDSLARRQFW